MPLRADVEFIAGVIRVWDGGSYGDPYRWAATVRWIDRTQVEILGVTSAPTVAELRAILQQFNQLGVERVVFKRIKNGVSISRCLKTGRAK